VPGAERGRLTREEIRLRKWLRFFAMLFAFLALTYLYQGFFQKAEFPFVANSVTKDGFFAAMCVLAFADLRRFSWAVTLVIAGHFVLLACLILMAIFGQTWSVRGTFGGPLEDNGEFLLWMWTILAFVVIVLLGALSEAAARARYELKYLSHPEYVTVQALAEVLVPWDKAEVRPEKVARNVDDYLASLNARLKWQIRAALFALSMYPLLFFRPGWPIMSVGMRRRFIEKRFLPKAREGRRRRWPWSNAIDGMIRAAQQMVYVGYYGDPRGGESTGYVPFTKRDGYREAMARVPRDRWRLEVTPGAELDGRPLKADVVVVGSGAAGSILAHDLADRGRDVVVLERGPHIDPSEFTEDEKVQISNLYRDGALQLSRDLRFSVLQGMCVGGTTVVNNAVCFDLPEPILERWNAQLGAGLDADRLRACFRALREWLPVVQQSENGTSFHQPGAAKFEEGIEKLGLNRDAIYAPVEANIIDCLGSGYCNIGCQWGKKLSALDTTLPRAQRRFGADRVRIVSDCQVERVERDGHRATAVICRRPGRKEKLRVEADTVVIAAGALASSVILQQSGIKAPAGKRVSFNVATPVTADFPEKLDAYAGMQICRYMQPKDDDGLVLETWFNPVMMQSLFMPGWFDDHWRNMQRYTHMTCFGVVVGSRDNGRVKRSRLTGALDLAFTVKPEDHARLIDGMKLAGRIAFAARAHRVMPPTFGYAELSHPDQLDDLDRIVRDAGGLMMNSAHPQGGNPVGGDPERDVVDAEFRVRHRGKPVENLYVADASVFPSSVTVNPQLTVMALAAYAAQTIE
jgi:choline dehydrogenase-like flavoprotein